MSYVINFLDFSIIIYLKRPAKSPQKVAFRMSIHYFSHANSLLFANQKVTSFLSSRLSEAHGEISPRWSR